MSKDPRPRIPGRNPVFQGPPMILINTLLVMTEFPGSVHDEVLDQVRLDKRRATGVQSLEDDVRVVIQFQVDDDHLE